MYSVHTVTKNGSTMLKNPMCAFLNYHSLNLKIFLLNIYDNVCTHKLYVFFVGVLMILAGSLEFEKGHNNEIQERPSDNIELPEVKKASVAIVV